MRRDPVGRVLFPPEDDVLLVALACERARAVELEPPSVAAEPPPTAQSLGAPGPVLAGSAEESAPSPPPVPDRCAAEGSVQAGDCTPANRRPPRYVPLSRFSVTDVCERAFELGLAMSYSTVWRRLDLHALQPWFHEQWLFPRDPDLVEKASPILDLYRGYWQDEPLAPTDCVLCGDEMTGLQAVSRIHRGIPPAPGRRARCEFEYDRHGTLCYTAFLDTRSGWVYGRTSKRSGIEPFETALSHCLTQPRMEPFRRVFLIMDNGSAHHPSTAPRRLIEQFPQVVPVHLPVHSSWLNQVEIYFSILIRKALTPRDFASVDLLAQHILRFEGYYNEGAQPFNWRFSRRDLEAYVERLARHEQIFVGAAEALEQRRRDGAPASVH